MKGFAKPEKPARSLSIKLAQQRPNLRLHQPDLTRVTQPKATTGAVSSCAAFDFGSIAVFSDSEHSILKQEGVLAATFGDSIHLTPAVSRMPLSEQRATLAHEFVHVAQQHNHQGLSADEDTLEREANLATQDVLAGRGLAVHFHAAAAVPHYQKQKCKYGDVALNDAAQDDIANYALAPYDNSHVCVDGKKLGYDTNLKDPQDPFRWNQIQAFVDKEHINIKGVDTTDDIPAMYVKPPDAPVKTTLSLAGLKATGVTILTLKRDQAINPGAQGYGYSQYADRDEIYYEKGGGKRAANERSSLPHELFGHFGLARQGASWEHSKEDSSPGAANIITASQHVSDPLGQAFVGEVNDYISGFAANRPGVFMSPTAFVSPAFLNQALKNLAANQGKGLISSKTNPAKDFQIIWQQLSQNYSVLEKTESAAAKMAPKSSPAAPKGRGTGSSGGSGAPPASPTKAPPTSAPPSATSSSLPTKADIETAVMSWYGGLTNDQQLAFRQYLSGLQLQIGGMPTELNNAILAKLPKPTQAVQPVAP
ncbi:MAG TPA: DUF4157 domain-containing protein [Candidatus Angelobacter sp.]